MIEEKDTRAIIVGLNFGQRKYFEHSMDELKSLTEACNMEVVGIMVQSLPHPDAATYMGSGKIEELTQLAHNMEAEYVIFEDNLSPAQLKNIKNILKVEVWDRTTLILEIFTLRARTREARLQVESAYLQYMLPRLTGMWAHLGRQGGGGGSRANKGEGETQIELDRRQIRHRIDELGRELKLIEKTRQTQRSGRDKGDIKKVALVGYTNAGKSTIMNALLEKSNASEEKKVFKKDMLFATLDTSIRLVKTEDNRDFLLSDTVGFIENLPHDLVKAFHSTLEEAIFADLLLIVIDASDEFHSQHKAVTENTLKEIKADTIPRIYVMNKADKIEGIGFEIPRIQGDTIFISAEYQKGLDELTHLVQDTLYGKKILIEKLIPYNRGDLLNLLHSKAKVLSEEYTPEGIYVKAECKEQLLNF